MTSSRSSVKHESPYVLLNKALPKLEAEDIKKRASLCCCNFGSHSLTIHKMCGRGCVAHDRSLLYTKRHTFTLESLAIDA